MLILFVFILFIKVPSLGFDALYGTPTGLPFMIIGRRIWGNQLDFCSGALSNVLLL